MYSKTVQAVEIPQTGGKAKVYKSGYVYWVTQSHWDNEKKMTVDDRVCIGKSAPDKIGWIYPNERFFRLFNSVTESQQGKTQAAARGKFSVILNFGVQHVLMAAAQQCGCLEALRTVYTADECSKMLAVAIHAIDAQNSVAQDFPDWHFHNYCGLQRALTDGEISALYSAIAERPKAIAEFMTAYRERFYQKFPDNERRAVGLDSTNQNTFSSKLPLAEFGHSKVNEGLPCINTAMFVDEFTGIPLYYEHFCGSLLDKTQTPFTLEKAKELGFSHLMVMMDRGYLSKENLKALHEGSFGMMCPEGLKFSADLIAKYRQTIKDQELYYIASENIYGIHLPDTEYEGAKYDAYVYYDAQRAQDERDSIHSRILFFKSSLMKKKRYSANLAAKFSPWLIVKKTDIKDQEGRNFTCRVNTDKLQEQIDAAGYFVILSNAGLGAKEMIEIARLRDTNEKVFKRLKYHLGLTKSYVHNLKTFEGKMFVAFIALVIVEAFRYFAKPILQRKTSETVARVLGEMRKYQIRLKNTGQWMPQYAVTAKQKDILKCVDSDAAALEGAVRAVHLRV